MTASVFIGTSVDGFIARRNGALDFLPEGGGEPHGYNEFIASVDAIVIGRKTFETVLTFGAWPYGDKRVVVLSSRPLDFSGVRGGVVEQMAGQPREIVSQAGPTTCTSTAGSPREREANQFLRESYLAEFDRKFAWPRRNWESAFVPVGGKDLERIFTLQHERVVNRDNTISFANRVLQIERTRWRGTLAGCRVVVCEHLEGSLTVYYGPHRVGFFPNQEQQEKAPAESCGKDAALGNPAESAGFPLSHSPNSSKHLYIGGEEQSNASGHVTC